MSKPTAYFACALSNAGQEHREQMSDLRQKLKEYFNILEFYSDPTEMNFDTQSLDYAQNIYKHDIKCVQTAEIILAEVSLPSIGLGIELGTAIHNNKSIIAFAKENSYVSRMVTGITYPKFEFFRYQEIEQILSRFE